MPERDMLARPSPDFVSINGLATTATRIAARAPGSDMAGASSRLPKVFNADTIRRSMSGHGSSAHHLLRRLQRQYGNHYVGHVLRQVGSTGPDSKMDTIERSIDQARGGGHGMDHGLRSRMESAFGADFSGVRIHTDTRADGLSQSLSARAFTTGRDVFFRQGEYSPGTSSGRELLAHELTHVVQQNGHGLQLKMTVSEPGDAHEVEADRVAQAIMQQEHAAAETVHTENSADRQQDANRVSRLADSGGPVIARPPAQLATARSATALTDQVSVRSKSSAYIERKCEACGKSPSGGGSCAHCNASREPDDLREFLTGKAKDAKSGATSIELVPDTATLQLSTDLERKSGGNNENSISKEVIPIRHAIVHQSGVSRRIPASYLPGAWISRAMNWRRTACHTACWGLGGGLGALIAAACAIGSVVTIGGLAIPCTYLVVGGAVAAGGLAALCSDACDQVIAENPGAAADADPAAPAVADASGQALSDDSASDLEATG
jgi:hypothetical protein